MKLHLGKNSNFTDLNKELFKTTVLKKKFYFSLRYYFKLITFQFKIDAFDLSKQIWKPTHVERKHHNSFIYRNQFILWLCEF